MPSRGMNTTLSASVRSFAQNTTAQLWLGCWVALPQLITVFGGAISRTRWARISAGVPDRLRHHWRGRRGVSALLQHIASRRDAELLAWRGDMVTVSFATRAPTVEDLDQLPDPNT